MRLRARDAKGSEYDFAGWKPDLRVMPALMVIDRTLL
jgi:hypothetical protein